MTNPRPLSTLRRLGLALLPVLCLVATLAPADAAPVAASSSAARAGDPAAYDAGLREADCDLLGREYTKGLGCSRTTCTDGAVLWRKTFGAEACALKGAPKGFGFVATIDSEQCQALNRRWLSRVNYCASEADRSTGVLYNAPQCLGAASVYVLLPETEGYYDECLTPQRAGELTVQAGNDQSTLAAEVSARSAVQCPHRPGRTFVNGFCVTDPSSQPAGGGVVMIGDSLTWRGTDELAKLRPTFTLDGEPARRPSELKGRLDFYRALHGEPAGLIIELGTVPAKGYSKRDLTKVVRTLPKSTQIMFVQPYYELNSDPVVVSPASKRMAGWMRALASSRKNSCTADWPGYVRTHAGVLQDGVHTKHAAEGRWARWVSQQWSRC